MNIWQIREQLGLRKTDQGYNGVFCTGEFDQLHDYGAGLLELNIKYSKQADGIWVRFSLGTIDDGNWAGWDFKNYKTEEEAQERVEEIKKTFDKHMGNSTTLPTEETLNKWLSKIGLYGVYTG